ncbi:hypothetical protein [Fundidesulfovibrio terrae]|uniref:hypothetical protein n=1 Tax=Fundidesulfovibrio terrae TaxID=2922866 RepID=UPI001FB04857|nr:hypothetical protein [Fundidesulfovibrio terrae]
MGRDFEDSNENNGVIIIPPGEGAPPVNPGTAYGTVDRSNVKKIDSDTPAPLDLNIYGAAQNKAHPIADYAQAQTNKVLDKAVYNNSAPAGSAASNALKTQTRQQDFEDYSSKYGDTPIMAQDRSTISSSEPAIDTRPKMRMATEEEIQQRLHSNTLPTRNAALQGGVGFMAGLVGGPAAALAGGLGAATNALISGTPSWMKDSYEHELRTEPSVPIFENMTPDEIGTYYGRP